MKKIVVFGAAVTGEKAYELLHDVYNIAAFADNDKTKWGQTLCSIPIISPDSISMYTPDEIVIASIYWKEIIAQLNELGFHTARLLLINEKGFVIPEITGKPIFEDCKKREFIKITREMTCLNKQKKVLFCSFLFPPTGGGGIIRSLKFVKYLREFDYEPIVLSANHEEAFPLDETLLEEIPSDIEVLRISTPFPVLVSDHKTEQEIFDLFYNIVHSDSWIDEHRNQNKECYAMEGLYFPEIYSVWANKVIRNIESYVDIDSIDIVYTTCNPYSTLLIGYYLKCIYGIPWLADYRDPWAANDYYNIHYHFKNNAKEAVSHIREFESSLLSKADRITVAGSSWIEDFIKKYNIPREQICEIPNGYDEDDYCELRNDNYFSNQFTIYHNGWIYIDRNPIPLINAINSLIQNGDISSNTIRICFQGRVEKEWEKKILKADRYALVSFEGEKPHVECLATIAHANMLALFLAPDEGAKYIFPGKFYEYLRIGKTIIAYGGKGSQAERILDGSGRGKCIRYEDQKKAQDFILDEYRKWERGLSTSFPLTEQVKQFDRRVLTGKLASCFDDILQRRLDQN